MHETASLQTSPFGQGAAVPGVQAPWPSHPPAGVSVEPAQLGVPHVVPRAGKTHAPAEVVSHPVAPQAPPIGLHDAPQQFPVWSVPQTPVVHASSREHETPGPT